MKLVLHCYEARAACLFKDEVRYATAPTELVFFSLSISEKLEFLPLELPKLNVKIRDIHADDHQKILKILDFICVAFCLFIFRFDDIFKGHFVRVTFCLVTFWPRGLSSCSIFLRVVLSCEFLV